MASVALDTPPRPASEPAAKSAAELIDARALAAELEKLARGAAATSANCARRWRSG